MDDVSNIEQEPRHEYPVGYQRTKESEEGNDDSNQRKTTAEKILDGISEIGKLWLHNFFLVAGFSILL